MFCAISGVTPEEPVVSTKSGLLFERRLIEKALQETGLCPVTGESLTAEELVPIKSNKAVKPRPLQAASIPGMLTLFQNEWDAVALRDYALEQQLNTAREELSHALYQSDAACRVIARLIRERDEARHLLAQAERQLASGVPAVSVAAAPAQPIANGKRAMEVEEEEDEKQALKRARQLAGITEAMIADMTEFNKVLSAQRKKREIPSTLATPQMLEEYTQISSHPLHKTTKPGILCLDILGSKDLIATGGMDGSAVVFNKAKGEIVSTLTGHSKRVTAVRFVPDSDVVLSASADKTTRIWKRVEGGDGAYNCEHILKDHSGEVKSISVHATNRYFVTASSDKTWAFYDIESGACLTQVADPTVGEPYTAAAFHPDGLILGTGTADSLVRIWDIKSQSNVAKFEGHEGPVTSIHFSENGYFLATSASDGVKLWDLRRLKNFRSFPPDAPQAHINTVRFDFSGSYLAAGGSELRVYQVGSVRQEWPIIKAFPDVSGTGKITCLDFGPDASYIALGSMDRNLRIFGSPTGSSIGGDDMQEGNEEGS